MSAYSRPLIPKNARVRAAQKEVKLERECIEGNRIRNETLLGMAVELERKADENENYFASLPTVSLARRRARVIREAVELLGGPKTL